VQSTSLYQVDLTTNVNTLITNQTGLTSADKVNSIGYNVLDNFIYGTDQASNGSTYIIQIAGNGVSKPIGLLDTNRNTLWNVGDVDTSGRLWLSVSGGRWAQVDVVPGSSTFGRVIQSGTSTGASVLDWVYMPAQGNYLWSIVNNAQSTALVSWGLDTHVWRTVRTLGSVAGSNSFGGLFTVSNNSFYGIENTGAGLWRFNVATGTSSKVANGIQSSLNDGARCVNAFSL